MAVDDIEFIDEGRSIRPEPVPMGGRRAASETVARPMTSSSGRM